MNKHFHQILAFKELNMRRSSYEAVKICLCYPEIHINPIHHISWDLTQNILSHLHIVCTIFPKMKPSLKKKKTYCANRSFLFEI
jgi:hypothetical protein